VKLLRNATSTGAVLVSAAALRHSLGFIVLGVLLLACVAAAIITSAAFCTRSAPMSRIRALVRDIRGDHRASMNKADDSASN
jgi:hypothetical protein